MQQTNVFFDDEILLSECDATAVLASAITSGNNKAQAAIGCYELKQGFEAALTPPFCVVGTATATMTAAKAVGCGDAVDAVDADDADVQQQSPEYVQAATPTMMPTISVEVMGMGIADGSFIEAEADPEVDGTIGCLASSSEPAAILASTRDIVGQVNAFGARHKDALPLFADMECSTSAIMASFDDVLASTMTGDEQCIQVASEADDGSLRTSRERECARSSGPCSYSSSQPLPTTADDDDALFDLDLLGLAEPSIIGDAVIAPEGTGMDLGIDVGMAARTVRAPGDDAGIREDQGKSYCRERKELEREYSMDMSLDDVQLQCVSGLQAKGSQSPYQGASFGGVVVESSLVSGVDGEEGGVLAHHAVAAPLVAVRTSGVETVSSPLLTDAISASNSSNTSPFSLSHSPSHTLPTSSNLDWMNLWSLDIPTNKTTLTSNQDHVTDSATSQSHFQATTASTRTTTTKSSAHGVTRSQPNSSHSKNKAKPFATATQPAHAPKGFTVDGRPRQRRRKRVTPEHEKTPEWHARRRHNTEQARLTRKLKRQKKPRKARETRLDRLNKENARLKELVRELKECARELQGLALLRFSNVPASMRTPEIVAAATRLKQIKYAQLG